MRLLKGETMKKFITKVIYTLLKICIMEPKWKRIRFAE